MKHFSLSLIMATILLRASSFSQGWQFLGPDSANWQNVVRVSGQWTSPGNFKLAAATAYSGIAIFSGSQHWSYPLRTWYDPFFETGVSYIYFDFSPWDPDSAFVGFARAYTEPAFYIQKMSHTGSTLLEPTRSGCWITPVRVLIPHNSDSIVFASVCGIHRSGNRGGTWDTLSASTWGTSCTELLTFNETAGHILYKSDGQLGSCLSLFRSTNRGRAWDSIFTVGFEPTYNFAAGYNVLATGDTLIVGVHTSLYDTSHSIGIYRSSDGGATWGKVYRNYRVFGLVRSPVSSNTLFTATEQGILRSTDAGLTWTIYNNGLPTQRLTSLLISPHSDTMFVSTTTNGVLKAWNYITEVEPPEGKPETFQLYQNFPNPFNPSTKIRFRIADYGWVTLKVFDVLGREVATLVNEEMSPGRYERTFDARGLASGVYLYQLRAGSFTDIKNLILLR